MKGYKGFDKDLKCKGKQYEIGETFHENEAILCDKGLHFCESPLDVFAYYPPADSRYAEIEASDVSDDTDKDSKRVCKTLKIKCEIGLPGLIKAGVEFIKSQVDWENDKVFNNDDQSAATNTGYQSAATNTGDQSAATNTGDQSAATNTGYQSAATNTGYQSAAIVKGKESVAAALGIKGKAKGGLGSWLVLAEWKYCDGEYYRTDVKAFRVDGEKIKENTFYQLINGEAVKYE